MVNIFVNVIRMESIKGASIMKIDGEQASTKDRNEVGTMEKSVQVQNGQVPVMVPAVFGFHFPHASIWIRRYTNPLNHSTSAQEYNVPM
jgi:hypothetical protein